MISIILKIILCSSIFITIYYLLLEKERMYRFNRWYLLGSILFSYVIPFITVTLQRPETESKPQIAFEETAQQMVFIQPEPESFNWMNIVLGIYAIITLFLLIQSLLSFIAVRRIRGQKRIHEHYNIILTHESISPFSFWNTIYMGKNYMENNMIDQRIFLHEKTHIDQKHSVDLIVLELLKIFTWFNPVLFLYKKAVVTNHEFLADEAVLQQNFNIQEYQHLILEEILSRQSPPLTHSFNFNNTKKRFIMMKTTTSKFSLLKKTAGITTLIAAAVLFSERTYAGPVNIQMPDKIADAAVHTNGQDPYQEFKDILAKYADLLNPGKYAEFSKKVTESDKKRLGELYSLLNENQRNEQKMTFFTMHELKKRVPTESELTSFLNNKNYAVWIDSKKVENGILKNYKKTDFSNVYISKVLPNARTANNPQPYQVSLMTPAYFEKTKEEEKSSVIMGFKRQSLKKVPDTITPRENNKAESSEAKSTNIQEDQNMVSAEYPNGMKDLRAKIGKTMDLSNLTSVNGTIKSTAYIHIDENGKATNVTISGENNTFNNELLRTLTTINKETVWKPAMKDGKAIASVLKLPATMNFARP